MAVVKGRSRGNGAQLADYLENIKNDRVQLLEIRGTSHLDDLKKSLLEMSLTSELTKGVHGLYHAQFNPAIGEDTSMTPEDWKLAADIMEKHLEFEGQKRVIVLHEINGRIHAHITWERYDHETGILRNDGQNYKKHDQARAEIERVLGHEITPQRDSRTKEPDHKQPDHKRELSDLWEQTKDGKSFIREAEKAGYLIAKADDRRPWRVITPAGDSLDLVRQLDNAKTKDVRDRLQPIRDELKPEAEALAMARERAGQKEKTHEITDPWELGELANKMLESQRHKIQQQESEKTQEKTDPWELGELASKMLEQQKARQLELERKRKMAESHRQYVANMLSNPDLQEKYRKADLEGEKRLQVERERKLYEAQKEAKAQTEDKDLTDHASKILTHYYERSRGRSRERERGHDPD